MTEAIKTKVLVVGGGPGGYVAAIRAGQLGLDCVLVEADSLGGACLNRGCIPSKALIHAASLFHAMTTASGPLGISLKAPPDIDLAQTVRWKDDVVAKLKRGVAALLKRANVRIVHGWATFSDAKTCHVLTSEGPVSISTEHVILATGSVPMELPSLPFGGSVLSSTEMLSLDQLPRTVMVVGAGYIGLELGSALRKFGAEVTIVEARETILPLYDEQLTKPVRAWLRHHDVTVFCGSKVISLREDAGRHQVRISSADDAVLERPADVIVVAAGRQPRTAGWGLETMAVDMAGPFIKVDERCATSMKDVWAIGDLVGEPMLAHKASAQGEMVAEIISGKRRRFDPVAIPAVCFTEPEIVSVGLLPREASEAGIGTVTGLFPFSASGRAMSTQSADDDGFVRILARSDDHRVLGIQAVGAHVAELSGQFTQALEMGSLLQDVAGTIHAHPTMSEAFHESALSALGHARHV